MEYEGKWWYRCRIKEVPYCDSMIYRKNDQTYVNCVFITLDDNSFHVLGVDSQTIHIPKILGLVKFTFSQSV